VNPAAYHLGVTAVRAMANAANCNVDTSQSEAVRRVCETVGADSPSHLPAILVSNSKAAGTMCIRVLTTESCLRS